MSEEMPKVGDTLTLDNKDCTVSYKGVVVSVDEEENEFVVNLENGQQVTLEYKDTSNYN